jgi:hypothetical protein
MLASINVNLNVYIEPNELTWKIIRDNKKKYYSPKELDERIAEMKEHMTTVNVRGENKKLLKMQIWGFMSEFGDHMYMGMPGPCFENNQVFFETDELCPIYDVAPKVPEPVTYSVTKGSDVVIETDFKDGETVRVNFENLEEEGLDLQQELNRLEEGPHDVFAYWGIPGEPLSPWNDQIVDGEQDYIIHEGKNKIIIHNHYDGVLKCKLSFAPYKKKD